MEIYQRHLLGGYTRLTITADGLLVDRKRLTSYLWVEIPYEELLPVRGKIERSFPVTLTFFAVFCAFGSWVQELAYPTIRVERFATMTGATLALAVLCYFTYTRWKNNFVLVTGHGEIAMVAQPGKQLVMLQFVEDLRTHTKEYLRQRYANSVCHGLLGEEKNQRWFWLYERKVISQEEFEAGQLL